MIRATCVFGVLATARSSFLDMGAKMIDMRPFASFLAVTLVLLPACQNSVSTIGGDGADGDGDIGAGAPPLDCPHYVVPPITDGHTCATTVLDVQEECGEACPLDSALQVSCPEPLPSTVAVTAYPASGKDTTVVMAPYGHLFRMHPDGTTCRRDLDGSGIRTHAFAQLSDGHMVATRKVDQEVGEDLVEIVELGPTPAEDQIFTFPVPAVNGLTQIGVTGPTTENTAHLWKDDAVHQVTWGPSGLTTVEVATEVGGLDGTGSGVLRTGDGKTVRVRAWLEEFTVTVRDDATGTERVDDHSTILTDIRGMQLSPWPTASTQPTIFDYVVVASNLEEMVVVFPPESGFSPISIPLPAPDNGTSNCTGDGCNLLCETERQLVQSGAYSVAQTVDGRVWLAWQVVHQDTVSDGYTESDEGGEWCEDTIIEDNSMTEIIVAEIDGAEGSVTEVLRLPFPGLFEHPAMDLRAFDTSLALASTMKPETRDGDLFRTFRIDTTKIP